MDSACKVKFDLKLWENKINSQKVNILIMSEKIRKSFSFGYKPWTDLGSGGMVNITENKKSNLVAIIKKADN